MLIMNISHKKIKGGRANYMNKKDVLKGVVCERCGKSAPIDEERSNKNWIVYKTDKPCECGGRYILRVLYEMRKKAGK